MAFDKFGLADIKQEKVDNAAFKNTLRESMKGDNSMPGDKSSVEQPTKSESSGETGSRAEKTTPSQKESSKGPSTAPASAAPDLFEWESNGKKFNSWNDEAKAEIKRLTNLDKLLGKQAMEVKQHRARIAEIEARNKELEAGEVAQYVKQFKQYPDLFNEVLGAYKKWNQMKAGGATNAQASAATGLTPEMVQEMATKAFRAEAEKLNQVFLKQQEAENAKKAEETLSAKHAARIEDEEKALKTRVPDIDSETLKACWTIAQRFISAIDPITGEPKPMSLDEAYDFLLSQTTGKKPSAEVKEEPSRVDTAPKQRNLSETDDNGKARSNQAKKNIAEILKRSREEERAQLKG